MRIDKNLVAAGTAAACAWLGATAAHAADTHVVTINAVSSSKCIFNDRSSTIALTIDPAASGTLQQTAGLVYRCTNGTTPSFALASSNGNFLRSGTESFSYGYSSSGAVPGTGMGTTQAKTLSFTATVDQSQAANATPGTYTDTVTVTVNP